MATTNGDPGGLASTFSKLSFGFSSKSPGKVISIEDSESSSGSGDGDGGDSGDLGSDGAGFVEANDVQTGQVVNAVGIKIPPFIPHEPLVWFMQAECQFRLRSITAPATK